MTVSATANSTNVPLVYGELKTSGAYGVDAPILAWTMLPMGFGGTAGTLLMGLLRPSRKARTRRSTLWLLPLSLLLVLGISGCSKPTNYKIYTITVTGTNSTGGTVLTQSATVDLTLAQ
jgi:predicted MFS family arabinose efflux permease